MASLHQFILSIFLLIIINGNSSSQSPSPSFSCGDVKFGYPFWQRSQNSNHYGYPDLGISCVNTTPTIQIDSHMYHVKRVNTSEKTLVVSFFELDDEICPVASHDVVINGFTGFLKYSAGVKMLRFFYNCTVYPSGVESIKCLQIGANHAYVFLEGSVPEFDWKGDCESPVTVPVMEKTIRGSLVTSFGHALKEGFELKWTADVNCKLCESSGGFCEYSGGSEQFFCSCSGGRRFANCRNRGPLTRNFKFGVLSIGLLSCCIALAVIIFRIITKGKKSIYKRGFNPISSIEK